MGSLHHFLFSLFYHLTSIGEAWHRDRDTQPQNSPAHKLRRSRTGFQLPHRSALPAFFQMIAFLFFPYGENLLRILKI